jgi:1-acyl-sn-glycerol-3-phosphate acyltransferase
MKMIVLGLFTYLEFFALAVLFLPILLVVALFTRADPVCRRRGQWMRRFGRLTGACTPLWRFAIEGTRPESIDTRPFVVVSNHLSTADPFLLAWVPWDMRWVAKEEIFKLPLIGWLMRLGGDIPLRRGKRDSVKQMLEECRRTLQNGLPVMFFPEGSRSKDGALGPFKDGAFQLAIETQVPVLPVAIAGTRQCRPKGSLWFGEACARARVLAPLSTKGMTLDDLPALRDKAREIIQRESERLRRDLGAMESRVPAEARS